MSGTTGAGRDRTASRLAAAGRARWLITPAYIAAAFVAYWPVVSGRSDFLDSYSLLDESNRGRIDDFAPQLLLYGRPLYFAVLKAALSLVHDIDDLRVLRIIAVVGMGLLAASLHVVLARAGLGRLAALFIPIVVCTLPPFQVWASWGICFPFPVAAALAVMASLSAHRMLAARRRTRAWWLCGLATVLLLVVSITIYQPSWTLFFACSMVLLLFPNAERDRPSQQLADYLTVVALGLVTVAFDAVLARALKVLVYPRYHIGSGRTRLATDVVGKAAWFWNEPLKGSARAWQISPTTDLRPVAVVVLALFAVALVVPSLAASRPQLLRPALVLSLLPMTYLPNLVTSEDWASYRTRAGLAAAILMMACVGALTLLGQLPVGRPRRAHRPLALSLSAVAALVLGAAAVTGIVSARRTTQDFFVRPQTSELRYVRHELIAQHADRATSIVVITCTLADTPAPFSTYFEFGTPSCAGAWVPASEVRLVWAETYHHRPTIPVTLIQATDPVPPGATLIDMRGLCCRASPG